MSGNSSDHPDEHFESVRRHDETVTFCLAAPFDEVCRDLDAGYIERAWRALGRTLAAFGLDASELRWGWGHTGVMGTPTGAWEQSPLAGVGWLMAESEALDRLGLQRDENWNGLWAKLDETLRECDPPLMVALHGYRSYVVTRNGEAVSPDDGERGVGVLSYVALGKLWSAGDVEGDGPFACGVRAIVNKDRAALDAALAATHRLYRPAGAELVTRGIVGRLLDFVDWPEQHGRLE